MSIGSPMSQAYGAQGANGPTCGPNPDYRPSLCVSDYVKLATAGVKMDFKDIRDQIVCDLPDMSVVIRPPRTLKEAFWDRWRRANRGSEMNYCEAMPSFDVKAHQHGDTVYVLLCPQDEPPFVIEDTAILFPSDALMAKIGLRRKA